MSIIKVQFEASPPSFAQFDVNEENKSTQLIEESSLQTHFFKLLGNGKVTVSRVGFQISKDLTAVRTSYTAIVC